VVVPLASVTAPAHPLEGTRLTLVRVPGQPDAAEFSIRTPVTPPRWKRFDGELEAAWERAVAGMMQGDEVGAARAILQVGFLVEGARGWSGGLGVWVCGVSCSIGWYVALTTVSGSTCVY